MSTKHTGTFFCIALISSSLLSTSKTFFMPRSVTHDPTYELAGANFDHYHSADKVSFSVMPLYQKSTQAHKTARYFLPHNACAATLKEDGSGTLGSLWFNLIGPKNTDYSSTITIAPERTVYGAYLELFAWLYKGLWASITTTVGSARHNCHLQESHRTTKGTIAGYATAFQAFNSPSWHAGKISTHHHTATGADDIQCKLGYSVSRCGKQHIGLYLVGTIPTGTRPRSCFLFEPVWGSKHGAFGGGITTDMQWYETEHSALHWMVDVKYRYAFKAHERRSFDLCPNGEWSRYLLVVHQETPFMSQPGINALTLPVSITPRGTIDAWTALHYQHNCFHLEAGYTLWWRQAEKLALCRPDLSSWGVYDMAGVIQCNAVSAHAATISQSVVGTNVAPSDAVFTPLTSSQINLTSTAHPHALSNKVYGGLSYDITAATDFGIFGSYEWGHSNAALSQWALWATLTLNY